jgi:sugar phosphate isomerase/epimerase
MTPPLSVQLYSLRVEAAQDFEGVLRRLGSIGYVGVEPAGLHGMAPERFTAVLDEAGLVVSSAHVPLPVGEMAGPVLDENEAIGNNLLISGGMPTDFTDADAVKRTAERFNEAAANAAERGMTVGYHNHWWEFDHEVDGRTPYELFADLVDPSVFYELDIYWAHVGGHAPADVIRARGDRMRFLHVKDGPVEPRQPMVAAGEGVIDLATALTTSDTVEWHVVELDSCATDMFTAIEQSHRFLTGAGLSRGR